MRARPSVLLFLLLLTAGALSACGSEEVSPRKTLPGELHWSRVDGAEHYVVRLWSGYRLLVEESTPDTVLVLDRNILRTTASFDSLSLEVVGMAGEGETARKLGASRRRLRP
jgi:hypothetical protein